MTDKTREAQAFKAAMQSLTHADMPGGNLWEVTTVREKALMLKAWQACAALAAPSAEPVARRWWRHLKRQTVYVEESRGELQSAGGPVSEGTRLVSYRGQDGKVWYRPVSEFEDGRFEMLATPAQPPAAQPVATFEPWHLLKHRILPPGTAPTSSLHWGDEQAAAPSETTVTEVATLTLATLPALRQPLDAGTFAGVITMPDGQHYAVVWLDKERPKTRLNFDVAKKWANSVGGQLITRAIGSLLVSTLGDLLPQEAVWTCEEEDDTYAWYCNLNYGNVNYGNRGSELGGVAVRLIPIDLRQALESKLGRGATYTERDLEMFALGVIEAASKHHKDDD